MTNAEMHDLEKAMMNDPMLSDAVEGYREHASETDHATVLANLPKQLNTSTPSSKVVTGNFKKWMSIAAGFIVLLSGAMVIYRTVNQKKDAELVKQLPTSVDSSSTVAITQVDSTTVAINEVTTPTIESVQSPKPVIIPPATRVKEKKQVAVEESSVAEEMNTNVAKEDVKIPEQKPVSGAAKDQVTAKQESSSKAPVASEGYVKLNRFNGKIVDQNNNPLPFANITEKNSGVGTYADANGNFVLLSADSVLNVQTKSMGFVSTTSQIRTNANSKIVLKDEPAIANAPSANELYERNKNRVIRSESDTTSEELEAEPYDGWSNYNLYVGNNRRDPFGDGDGLNKKSVKAEVQLSFDVNPDGSLANIKVDRSNCSSCNSEAIRLLKEGPKWKSKTGKKERTKFVVRF